MLNGQHNHHNPYSNIYTAPGSSRRDTNRFANLTVSIPSAQSLPHHYRSQSEPSPVSTSPAQPTFPSLHSTLSQLGYPSNADPASPLGMASISFDAVRQNRRQVSLHFALKHLSSHTGADIWTRIRDHLATVHEAGRRSQVLDVGCGTGIFCYDLAKDEEFADVIGMDISLEYVGQSVSEDTPHDNVEFTECDFRTPLPWQAETFDVIHIRNVSTRVASYSQLIERCATILRQGGILIVTELENFFHSAVPGQQLAGSLRIWHAAMREALTGKNIDYDNPSRIRMLVGNTGMFRQDTTVEEIGIPTGGEHVGADHFDPDMVSAFFESHVNLLLDHGYGPLAVQELHRDCVAELTAADDRYFQRITTVCAHKLSYS